eukprot:3175419-Pleurochrysis_carterae.AAC.2
MPRRIRCVRGCAGTGDKAEPPLARVSGDLMQVRLAAALRPQFCVHCLEKLVCARAPAGIRVQVYVC